ncbi:transposase [Streptomyces sp. NPDC090075]|uniref:transposase n=1 Tax=Streptomyces sp. NPDC090075 TaxID=3365937 RepID=UPI0037FA8499
MTPWVIPNDVAEMVTATTRRIFARPDQADIRSRLDTVTDNAGTRFPQVKWMPMDANEDLTVFPDRHWKEIRSTNPLEPLNREIKRRVDGVQVLPTRTRCCDWSPRRPSRCTASGSPSLTVTSRRGAWTRSVPTPPTYTAQRTQLIGYTTRGQRRCIIRQARRQCLRP